MVAVKSAATASGSTSVNSATRPLNAAPSVADTATPLPLGGTSATLAVVGTSAVPPKGSAMATVTA